MLSSNRFLSLCSSESMPDLLTSVKILAGSTVEIAAASVGERSLVKAVLKIEEDGKSLDSLVEEVESKILEGTVEVVAVEGAEEGAVVENEEELNSAEDTGALAAEESSAPVIVAAAAEEEEQEEAAASPPEEATTSAPAVEDIGEAEAEDEGPVIEGSPEEVSSPTEASPEDVGPAEEEAVLTAAETSVDEAAAEAPAEEPTEAAAAVDTVQLAAASVESGLEVFSTPEPQLAPEAQLHEVKSCHCAPSAAAGEVAPPVALGEQLVEAAMEMTEESKEAVSESKNILTRLHLLHL